MFVAVQHIKTMILTYGAPIMTIAYVSPIDYASNEQTDTGPSICSF